MTKNSVEDEKQPGKLKSTECSFHVNLTPRCLLCQNRHDRHLGVKFFQRGFFFYNIFKAEWESRTGTFVALGNKMYQGFDNATESTKNRQKVFRLDSTRLWIPG